MVGRADARQHQEFGAVVAARCDQHLALGHRRLALTTLRVGHADGAALVDDDAVDAGAGDDAQPLVMLERIEEGFLRIRAPAEAPPLPIGVLHDADAGLLGAVEIGIVGMPEPLHREQEVLRRIAGVARIGDLQRAADAVELVVEDRVGFNARKMRQQVRVAPVRAVAEARGPAVIILALAAHVDHGVDGAAAAQGSRHRHDRPAAAQLRLRHRMVHLEKIFAAEEFHVARRHRHDAVGAFGAALQHQHPEAELADKPHRRDRSCGPAAGDDEIVGHALLRHPLYTSPV